jgi:glyoxylase-like metal-dependent hydrolase (beta-lactamase superfamily II)
MRDVMTTRVQFDLVAPGVYRAAVAMSPPLWSANAYLIFGESHAALVDTGWVRGGDWAHIRMLLDRASVDPASLLTAIVTHSHRDHLGHGPSLQAAWGTPILMHPLEETTGLWADREHIDELRKWLAGHGVPAGYLDRSIAALTATTRTGVEHGPLPDKGAVKVGSSTWQALHTPGHSPGHICLFREADGVLISGDHLLEEVSPNVSALPFEPSDPLGDYLRALRRVGSLRPSLVLPGHGEPFTDVDGLVARQEVHHAQRLTSVLTALSHGPRSAFEVAVAIPWTERRRRFGELVGAHRFLAFGETIAHLELLSGRGDVRCLSSGRTVTWLRET